MASRVIKLQNDSYTLLPVTDSNYVQYYNGTSYESTKTALDNRVKKVTSTDNAVVRFDGTGGNIQNSGVTIDDSNQVTAAKFITSGGTSNHFVKGDGSLSSTISTSSLTEPNYIAGTATLTQLPLVDTIRGNVLVLLKASQIIIEKTTDGGTTWVDAGISDAVKETLFLGNSSDASIPVPKINNVINKQCGLRITITAMNYNVPANTPETEKYNYWNSSYVTSQNRYCSIDELYIWCNGLSDAIRTRVYAATGTASTTWTTADSGVNAFITGWSGGNFIKCTGKTFGGSTGQTSNYWNWRFEFFTDRADGGNPVTTSSTYQQYVYRIQGFGKNHWGVPNNLMGIDHLYNWDSSQNATFPAKVTATAFVKSGGTSSQFLKADGSVDSNQYLTSAALTSYVKKTGDTMTGTLSFNVGADGYADSFTSKGINMGNANITGVNSIFTADASDDSREGIHFYRDSSHVDSIHAKNGVLYFTPNRPLNNAGTSYPVITTNSYSSEQISIPSSVTLSNHIRYVQGQEIDFDENFANTVLGTSTTVTPSATLNNTNTSHKYWYNT